MIGLDHANELLYDNEHHSANFEINLLLVDHHFCLSKSLPAFFKNSYYCHKCNKGYNVRVKHRCSATCKSCLRQDCPSDQTNKIRCPDCNRTFFGRNCFDFHKLGPTGTGPLRRRVPLCKQVMICPECACHYEFHSASKL